MPKTKFQDIIFTIMMVFVMVYGMICYNMAISMHGMSNVIFLKAFHELPIMGAIAFVLEFFLVGKIARKTASKLVNSQKTGPFSMIMAVSAVTVAWMCPLMSFAATLLFKDAGRQIIAAWLQTTLLNYPMALIWQFFVAGPLVRKVFGAGMAVKKKIVNKEPQENRVAE